MSLRQRKAEKKKEEMIQSALSLLSEKGYHGTTMEDIAAKLLMTKGSLYYYFKDKQELVYESHKKLMEQSVQNIERIIAEDLTVIEKLKKVMIVHLEFLMIERTGFMMGGKPDQFFEGEQLKNILELRSKYSEHIDELILQGIKDGFFQKVDVKVVRNIILSAMNHTIEWYSPKGSKSIEDLAQYIAHAMLLILTKD